MVYYRENWCFHSAGKSHRTHDGASFTRTRDLRRNKQATRHTYKLIGPKNDALKIHFRFKQILYLYRSESKGKL